MSNFLSRFFKSKKGTSESEDEFLERARKNLSLVNFPRDLLVGPKDVLFRPDLALSISVMDLTIILGAIRLMVDHPDVQAMSVEYHEMVAGIRETLLQGLLRLGLSNQQVEDMNTLYASESGSLSDLSNRVDLRKIFTVMDGSKKGES